MLYVVIIHHFLFFLKQCLNFYSFYDKILLVNQKKVGMFKTLVSGLIFSPTLAKEIERYEKKLRRDLLWQKIYCVLCFILLILSLLAGSSTAKNGSRYSKPLDNQSKQQVKASGFNISITATDDSSLKTTIPSIAYPGDLITYKLTASNVSDRDQAFTFKLYIGDILEYSELYRSNSGTLKDGYLAWPETTINKKSIQERVFTVQIKDPVPTFRRDVSDQYSFDCVISANFDNQLDIPIECPPQKTVEKLVIALPTVNNFLSSLAVLILLIILVTQTVRTQLLLRELSIIRRKFITGVI